MRFVIVNTDHPGFLAWLYSEHSGLEKKGYEEQRRVRMESLFGVADFYSSNLRALGHEAWDVYANNEFMQNAWGVERGIQVESSACVSRRWRERMRRTRQIAARTPLRFLKPLLGGVLRSLDDWPAWFYEILAAQIKYYKPDILLNQAVAAISSRFLAEMRPSARLLVGQIASPLGSELDLKCYDLMISSLPNFVEIFRRRGLAAALHRFGFDPRVLRVLSDTRRKIAISFVGSVSRRHQARINFLERVCGELGVDIWGVGAEDLPEDSMVRRFNKGTAWGLAMYQILHNSKMTLNHHIDVAEGYANNMRLFEATGVGTVLVTDWKLNIQEIFEPGKEVLVYRSPEECVELIQYYGEHEVERDSIAKMGQKRTLRDHTYYERMQELIGIVREHV